MREWFKAQFKRKRLPSIEQEPPYYDTIASERAQNASQAHLESQPANHTVLK